jgi:AAA15 family ATPase/GTPase
MLVYFAIENFFSIRDRLEFSLVPSAFFKEAADTLIAADAVPSGKLLPSAVIYGPNASGKSNIIAALSFMRAAVINSHTLGSPEGGVPRVSFALNKEFSEKPSTFELEFILEDVRFQYGFSATDEVFSAEWLYYFPHGRRQILFERNAQDVKFGRALKGQNKIISELMRPNSLYISVAAQNSHDQLSKVHRYIVSIDLDPTGEVDELTVDNAVVDDRIIEFLQKIGTGVIGFRRRKISANPKGSAFTQELRSLVARHSQRSLDDIPAFDKQYTLELAHKGDGSEPVYLELSTESDGTRRLLDILASVFEALDKGTVLIIDELDGSLHTQVGDAILAMFSNRRLNKKGAQLIATTHDTNLMGSKYLRRDQIWFTEKDEKGATHLFPLSDIRTRNTDNIEKGYLQGRYGAIPFSGYFEKIFNEKYHDGKG